MSRFWMYMGDVKEGEESKCPQRFGSEQVEDGIAIKQDEESYERNRFGE